MIVQDQPYFYQSDFRNFGFSKKGFYVDINGNQYHYTTPETDYLSIIDAEDFNLNTHSNQDFKETYEVKTDLANDNTIKPSELFSKLKLCEVAKSGLRLELTNEMIADLQNAQIIELESFMMDSGWRTKSIIVYIPEFDVYRQTILSECGNSNRLNQSRYTNEILKMFNELQ